MENNDLRMLAAFIAGGYASVGMEDNEIAERAVNVARLIAEKLPVPTFNFMDPHPPLASVQFSDPLPPLASDGVAVETDKTAAGA